MGKLKEQYLRDAMSEYGKRLSGFCRFETAELSPQKLPENPSESQIFSALEDEADKILARIPPRSTVFAMCVEGVQLSSQALAKKLEGVQSAVFVLGSSFGLSERVKRAADVRLSMSEMTFPHQLARVMLAEQVYRAFTIINNRKYHK